MANPWNQKEGAGGKHQTKKKQFLKPTQQGLLLVCLGVGVMGEGPRGMPTATPPNSHPTKAVRIRRPAVTEPRAQRKDVSMLKA